MKCFQVCIRIALRKKTFSRELCGAERGVILYNMLYSLARLLNIIYSVEKKYESGLYTLFSCTVNTELVPRFNTRAKRFFASIGTLDLSGMHINY